MEISTELTLDDYKEYTRYVHKSTSAKRYSSFWLNLLIWMVIGFVVSLAINLQGLRTNIHIPSALFALLLFFVIVIFYSWRFKKRMAPSTGGFVLGTRTYVIRDDGIKDIRQNYESFTKWDAITKLGETDKYLFLMLDTIAGHIIPKRDIQVREIEALTNTIKKRLANKA